MIIAININIIIIIIIIMNKKLDKDENGITLMNSRNLKIICERDELYQCPENNETLYLHFKGFDRI